MGAREFQTLAGHLNEMVDSLWQRKQAVMRALSGKVAVLRTLLPDSAVERVSIGDRHLTETVPQASVAVIVLRGLDELFPEGDVEANRTVLHSIVDDIDATAAANGLDRVKVVGDTYVAVCGLGTPHLDHAPRTVAFVTEAIVTINQLARDAGVNLSVGAGISSGSVSAGLIGDSRLIFDLWGDPVDEAYRLAHATTTDQVLVSDKTRERLPGGEELTPVPLRSGSSAWSLAQPAPPEGGRP
jgi:class 3 adenylate cyclase